MTQMYLKNVFFKYFSIVLLEKKMYIYTIL